MPVVGEKRGMRMSPESMTTEMPGSVTDVSAMLVARITFRRPPVAKTRSCASFGSDPYRGRMSHRGTSAAPRAASSSASAAFARRISPSPGRKQRMSPSDSFSARTTAALIGRSPR